MSLVQVTVKTLSLIIFIITILLPGRELLYITMHNLWT